MEMKDNELIAALKQLEVEVETGSLACLLAQRAETVVRVVCGLPQTLKGDSSCWSI